ncbi:MAG: bile acid:sodium symporter family protein [Candidatus Gastranaerophilales bacterium]|nr:bile acid:sodium symporter family protein [Candidatus Gastranaerophilales bacterium]
MEKLNQISNFIGKYMAVIILVAAFASLFFPACFLCVKTSYINYLLMIIMFGMGLTLKSDDFVLIFSHPREIFFGTVSQYVFMPLIALGLCYLFHLDAALTAGVILVGTCPGGTASNVITYLSKGDIALSVCMTSVNTLLAPILTPLITYLMLKTTVETNITAMFIGIIQVILVPIILGLVINKYFGKFTQKCVKLLPMMSVFAICLIVVSVVSHNSEKIFSAGLIILAVVILHNILGYLFGFGVGKLLGLNPAKTKAFSIEVGMQNSGLATSLASTAFPTMPEAAVPGAMFSVWHNISGAVLAAFYRKWHSD